MPRWILTGDAHRGTVAKSGLVLSIYDYIEVMPVSEHEERLAEAQRWADDPEHPNWEAGWIAGSRRAGPVTNVMVVRGAKAAWERHRVEAESGREDGSWLLPPWESLDEPLRETWLQDTRAAFEAVIRPPDR